MEYQHIKRIFKSPFFVNFKRHYCPNCESLLHKITVSKVVNSSSTDAKQFDFQNVDAYLMGNVKFIWTEFLCPKCHRQITIDEMKELEKKKG